MKLDVSGNVYIADQYNQRIRKVTVSTGMITTIAGSSTSGGFSGDGGQATSATLNYPCGLALDSSGTVLQLVNRLYHLFSYSGNVYIVDQVNGRIRKVVVSTGIITTIAGNGGSSYSGDNGAATAASLFNPVDVSLDISGIAL